MDGVTLKVDELVVRPWRPEDADGVYRACQDPVIPRWTSVPTPYLPTHAEQFVTEYAPRAWRDGTAAPMGVFDAASGILLGACGLVKLDVPTGLADIGYWTAPWARSRGVAVRAAREVSRWAFTDLGLRQIGWRAAVGNHTSRLVAQRLGVRIDGARRGEAIDRDGRLVDCWVGSLRPDELTVDDPAVYARGSSIARRAATFMGAQPRLEFTTEAGRPAALRAPTGTDIDVIYRYWQDAEIQRWTSVPVPYRREHAVGFLDYAAQMWGRGDGIISIVVDADDALVGLMDLRLKSEPGVADVGFATAAPARGRGYTTAALRTACRFGFDALAVERIIWQAYVGNAPSRRVAEKVGFTMEGTLRAAVGHRGERMDTWTASLLATDPAAQK